MADDLFNQDNLNNGLESTRAMVDSMRELRSLSEDFASTFGQDLVRNASAVNREFIKMSAQQEQFAEFEITRSEAAKQQSRLQLELNKLRNEQNNIEKKVKEDLAENYDTTKAVAELKREEYESMVDSGNVHTSVLRQAKAAVEQAEKEANESERAYKAGVATLENLQASLKAGKEQVKYLGGYVKGWDKANLAGGLMLRTMKGLAKVPLVGQLLNAKEASKAMNLSLRKGESSIKAFGKGVSAAFKGIEKSTIILAAISAYVKAIQFVFNLFAGAQKNTVEIARSLGLARVEADQLRKDFTDIAFNSGTLRVDSVAIREAFVGLTNELGVQVQFSDRLVQGQSFLTKLYNISGESAAKLSTMFAAQGTSVEEVSDNLQDVSVSLATSEGLVITQQKLMEKVASAGAEFAGYMGFSAEAIAQSVVGTTKMGINLQQASTIAKGLLDFESSISKELEAELLTGKQFNFELARSLALQGDFAGASAEVMRQVQGITEEQRKNPLIMQSLAAATGLTVEQLNEAYIRQTYLTGAVGKYHDELMRGGKEEQAALVAKMAARSADLEEMKKTIGAQDAFTAALNRAKEQFQNLVGSGVLDTLVDVLTDLGDYALKFGLGEDRKLQQLESSKGLSESQRGRLSGIVKEGSQITYDYGELQSAALVNALMSGQIGLDKIEYSQGDQGQLAKAGGRTYKVTDETVELLRELLEETKRGKVIEVGGAVFGETANRQAGANTYSDRIG
jgi:hypothetical protein